MATSRFNARDRIVVIGGYGNAGRPIVELLLRHTDRQVVVAGRNLHRAEAFASSLSDRRVTAAQADATDSATLAPVLDGAEVVILAAGTSATWQVSAEAALAAGCHQLDIQIGSMKNDGLRGLDRRASEASVCIVTDCGFHPGVPAAMVRAVAAERPDVARALVSSWIGVDWSQLDAFADTTVAEMVQEFTDYRYEALVDGRWTRRKGSRLVDFPPPIGRRRVAAMGLDEMRAVAAALPGLRDTGFYVGGFPSFVNYGVIPIVYAGMKLAPTRLGQPLGRLLDGGLRRFSRPPYTTYLQLDGGEAGQPDRPLMRLHHDDAYLLTAAPVVATVRQLLAEPRPGVHLQGMLVAPAAFFADLAAMGIDVWTAPSQAV